ncbi:calymmin precursor [Triplophysa rosa]|uniref:Calymmin n=1 Tax=Triplophysa rosa TaxID=992332 RepID=A0A9W7TII8_TRIRA|nr:calymmin precursor [Triplophysa rosa]
MLVGGYSLGPNSGSANIKGNGLSASLAAASGNGAAFKGQSVSLPAANGNGAMLKGYSASLPTANGNGATVKGQSFFPVAANGNGAFKGYGSSAAATQNGYGAKPNGAFVNTQSQPGYGGRSSLGNMGYPNNGGNGPKPGYGAKAGPYNGQAAKPQGSSLGNMGYPNNGGNGPKPGYGAKAGPYNGQAAKPQGSFLGNLGYPNSGINGPKPGYGAKAGPYNGQAAKPQGYSVPGGLSKGPYSKGINSGYTPAKNGKGGVSSGKGPKGETLSLNEQGGLPVSANTKGLLPQTEHETSTIFPSDFPSIMQQTKGPRPLLPQGKAPKPLAPQPVVPQGLPSNTLVQGASSYKPGKAYKPVAEAFSPSESSRIPQGKAPKPFHQVPQTVALAPEQGTLQEQNTRLLISQQIVPQRDISSTTSLVQGPQSKASRPETQLSVAFQPNQAMTQPWYPSTTNSAFGAGVSGYSVPGVNNGYKVFGGGHGSFPGAEFGNGYAGLQGGLPKGLGSEGKSQTKYGIGGRAFANSPHGYQSNLFEKYGNDGHQYGTKPYNVKAGFGGLPYNKQPLGYGGEKSSGKNGFEGFPYGGQPLGHGTDANLGISNPAVSYELLGPVTDGQSVDENRNLEAFPHGPVIDGQNSIDHFGEGEVPPQPDDPVILAAGDPPTKFTDKYGKDDFERIQPEVVSFPAAPTETPVRHIPAVTSFDSPEGSPLALVTGHVDSVVPDIVSEVSASPVPPQSEFPTLLLQPAPPQQIHIQQHLKFHFHPHGNSETGGKEGKHNLKGIFGNKYQE